MSTGVTTYPLEMTPERWLRDSPSHTLRWQLFPSRSQPGASVGAYQLLRRVGATGAFVETWAALQGDRPVLLKRLLESRPGMAERLADTLRHQRSPALLELGMLGDTLWLAFEGTEGESLRWVMSTLARSSGFIAPNEGLAVVARVAAQLAQLHSEGQVHGDVCPSTIFVTARGEVQLHEAGVAAALGQQGDLGPYRSEMNSLAPEQVNQAATPSSDVFRLGLLLYELAIGRPLWSGPSPAHICFSATSWPGLTREKVKQVPEPWLTLLVTMLSIEPSGRPSMEEVGVVLEQAVRQNGWSATDAEIARLFGRAAQERSPIFAPSAQAQELVLTSVLQGQTLQTPNTGRPAVTPPPGAVVARIATKKMTREELRAVRETPMATEALPPDLKAASLLVERGQLTRQQLQTARELATTSGDSLFLSLALGGADEDALISTLGEVTHTPSVSSKKVLEAAPGPEVLALVPLDLSTSARAVPLGLKGGTQLMVAMADPMDATALAQLKAALPGKSLIAFRAGERALAEARARLYPDASWGGQLEPGDALAFVGSGIATPVQEGASSQLLGRVVEALLGLQGARGATAQQLVSLAEGLARRMGLPESEVALARLAALAMVTGALAANRLPHDVPKLMEMQERIGFGTEADAFIEALHAWPARMPERPVVRAVVLAFAFSAHVGEPRPKGSRLGGALNSFRTRFQLAQPLFELLTRELS